MSYKTFFIPKLDLLFSFYFVTIAIYSQSKIDTDRPDQTESVYTIPQGWVQFEAGFNKQQNDKWSNEYFSPTLLSKYGISSKVELRLITTIVTNSTMLMPQGTTNYTGLDPLQIGAKVSLWEAKKWIPKTSLIFHFGIPKTASKNYDVRKIAPNFRFTINNGAPNNIADLVPLFSGNYSIRIYDKNNCFVDTNIVVTNPNNFLSLDFGKDIDSIQLGDSIFLDVKF